jgi:predicted flap endonuclease-1-like 5' DNA nuclease
MGELKGMGLANALALEKLKITRFDELARQNPADLASKLNRLGWMPVRAEEVKVWIRAAGKQAADAG